MSAVIPRRRSWLWMQGLACGAALAIATAPVILVAILLAPAVVGYMTEPTPGRPRSETMLLLGGATIFGPLRTLWATGHSMEACMALLGDPRYVVISWLAGASGWLLEEAAQIIARQISDLSTRQRIARLERERAELVAEWGPLVEAPPSSTVARR
jgi:hypothetical protein